MVGVVAVLLDLLDLQRSRTVRAHAVPWRCVSGLRGHTDALMQCLFHFGIAQLPFMVQ